MRVLRWLANIGNNFSIVALIGVDSSLYARRDGVIKLQ